MLCRFNFANPDGLFENAAFVELDAKTAEQFAALIRERLEHIDRTSPPAVVSPASPSPIPLQTSIPHNLPRLQSFFGREHELAKISEALAPDNRSWGTLIDGEGGMGKTTIAVRAAYAVPPAHFQRIIFVSVKKHELDDHKLRRLDALAQANWLEMLNEIARELGDYEIPKSAESERIGRVRAALAGKHVLLVLDNLEVLTAAEQDQLFTFLQRLPPDCKALLTSRTFIGNQQAAILLKQLDPEAALLLLADIAIHNPQFAKSTIKERLDLYHATGGRPLLLRWTAGQVGIRDCRTIADALARLRSCPPDNDPLEFVFGDLAIEFTEPEKKVLAALTYFTQPATVAHITTVASADPASVVGRGVLTAPPNADDSPNLATSPTSDGAVRTPRPTTPLDEPTVKTALATLANRSLVLPDTEERSYTLVPLVADFLRRKFPDLLAATGQSLKNRAYALIVENGFDEHARFPLLDAAWPTVAPAIPLFVAGPNPRLQTVCLALQYFLNFTGRWDEWLALSLQAEAKAVAAGDHDNAGWRTYHAGCVHHLRQQGDGVLTCAGRAATHWTTAKAGAREQSIAISLRGLGHQLQQDYPAALADARAVVELRRSLEAESADVAIGLSDVAMIERHMGDFSAAERDYREALRIARAVGDAEGVAIYTGNLADLALTRLSHGAIEK